jgi:hypothetical protein
MGPRRSAKTVSASKASTLSPGSGNKAGVAGFGSTRPKPGAPLGKIPSPSRATVLPFTTAGVVGIT